LPYLMENVSSSDLPLRKLYVQPAIPPGPGSDSEASRSNISVISCSATSRHRSPSGGTLSDTGASCASPGAATDFADSAVPDASGSQATRLKLRTATDRMVTTRITNAHSARQLVVDQLGYLLHLVTRRLAGIPVRDRRGEG